MKSAWTEPVGAELLQGFASCLIPTPMRWSACCRTGRRFGSSTQVDAITVGRHIEARYFGHRRRVLPDRALPRQPDRARRHPARGARAGGRDHAAGRRALRGEARRCSVAWRRCASVGSCARATSSGSRSTSSGSAHAGAGRRPGVGRRRHHVRGAHLLRGRLMLSRRGASVGFGGSSSSARSLRSPPRASSSKSSVGTAETRGTSPVGSSGLR